MGKLEIKLALMLSVPENGFAVNGILQGLEEQTPVVLKTILEQIFKALEERTVKRLSGESPGRYVLNGHQRRARKLVTHF